MGKNARFTAVLAALSLALSAAQGQATGYRDVPPGHWAAEAVEVLSKIGVITGFPDGTFRGNDPATRYQVALALHRLYLAMASGMAQATSPDLAEALQGAARAGQAADLLGQVLPPEVQNLALRMIELSNQIAALQEGLARTMGAVEDLNTFREALIALEGSQNEELLELRQQLELLKRLLAETVSREDYLKTAQRLADAAAEIAQEVTRLREAQRETEKRVQALEAFAKPRENDLSLEGFYARGQLSASPLPGPSREPLEGGLVGLRVSWKGTSLKQEAGLLEGIPLFRIEREQNGESMSAAVTPGGGSLAYRSESVQAQAWTVGQALGLKAQGSTGGLTLSLEAYREDPAAQEALYQALGLEVPQSTGAKIQADFNGAGPLNLTLAYGITPAGQWAKGMLGVEFLPGLALEGFYASPLDGRNDLAGIAPYERWAREYGIGLRIGEEARLVYRFLPEGSGPGAEVSLKGDALSFSLAGQYIRGSSPWYKVLGSAHLKDIPLLPLGGYLSFGIAQNLSGYQAFLETIVEANLGAWQVGVGYGEFASRGGFGSRLATVTGLNNPLLYGGGSGNGLAQWGTLTVGQSGLSLRYDLFFRPRPADRFSVSYSLQLP